MQSSGPQGRRHAERDLGVLRAMAQRIDQHDPGAHNNLGVLYFSKGLFAEAVDAFLRALELEPRMRTAARNLEVAAASPGACDVRLTALAVRLADQPRDVTARRERARLYRLIGRHADATQQLDALIAEDPDDDASLFERGLVEQRVGDLRRAQRWFERAVAAAADDTVPRLHLAEVLYQRGQNEQALKALDHVLARDATLADAHLLRGFVLGDMGRHDAAVAAARQAAELKPSLQTLQSDLSISPEPTSGEPGRSASADGTLARYGLGLAFRQRGYFQEARREFQRALVQGEDARLARHAIAEIDLVEGQFQAAKSGYESLLRDQPENARYWNELGVARHQGGDLVAAADAYREALRHDPRFALAYNNLGVALYDMQDAPAARESLQRAAELDPAMVRARLNLAFWLQRHREPMAALTLVRELVAFHPTDSNAWHALGLVCEDLQWLDEARGAYARAVEEQPSHAEARFALAKILGTLGDADGALRETEVALGFASVRTEPRMTVAIDLQRECPEACAALALLSIRHGDPLTGVALGEGDVRALLPERESTVVESEAHDVDDGTAMCDAADTFALHGAMGEALERYAKARAALERIERQPRGSLFTTWRRAALSEAKSLCLLGRGAEALPLLKSLGARDGKDVEVLALFAASAAAAGGEHKQAARTAILRIQRIGTASAAIMHFVGDVAVSLADESLAMGCYRRALTLDPARPSARVAIARLLREGGDLSAAHVELAAAMISAPDSVEAVLELARVHRDADRPTQVLTLLTRHLAAVPTDLDAMLLLAEALTRLNRDADARVAITRVLRHDPWHLHALWLDGVLLAKQSRLRDAIDRWRVVAQSSTNRPLAAKARRAMEEAEEPHLALAS